MLEIHLNHEKLPMNLQSIFATAALSVCLAAPASATVVEGTTINKNVLGGFMGEMTNIQILSGNDILPTTAFAFCIDHTAQYPVFGVANQYTLSDSFAPFMSVPAAENKVTALLHYAIDSYYLPLVQGFYGDLAGYGFNMAMWQLASSDGTQSSVVAEPNDEATDPRGNYALYAKIMNDLSEHFDTISPDYRSDKYKIRFLDNTDPLYQDLVIVYESTDNEVPEPSTLALLLAGGIGFAVRARRKYQA